MVSGRYRQPTLQELVDRLRRSRKVDAVAIIGSAGEGNLNAASDLDLLIVLVNRPLPITGGVTWVEGRFTDLIFTTSEEVRQLNEMDYDEIPIGNLQGTMVRWMKTARIEFDGSGSLTRLQQRAREGLSLTPPSDGETISRLDRASYNLAHTKRMLASDDPVYHAAVDLRFLYQLADLMVDYFIVRSLAWPGEKAAIRYWQESDPEYLGLFSKCLGERDRVGRVGYYEELAKATMAPVGPLWQTGTTHFRLSPDSEMTRDRLQSAEAFWELLVNLADDAEQSR